MAAPGVAPSGSPFSPFQEKGSVATPQGVSSSDELKPCLCSNPWLQTHHLFSPPRTQEWLSKPLLIRYTQPLRTFLFVFFQILRSSFTCLVAEKPMKSWKRKANSNPIF
ncbi:hypothetical protein CK203_001529 [Vitis vinifera]|uniref:Uncharacterized protein n=1 Tax=Vitis vinifera TaxID=29760 RepID=A0A438KLI4_VITVI|nr:hypothetical protein CK203_001529 [Vitis vinifera]